jgi:hypothetical protein
MLSCAMLHCISCSAVALTLHVETRSCQPMAAHRCVAPHVDGASPNPGMPCGTSQGNHKAASPALPVVQDASPDVVYSYTGIVDTDVTISTCGSGFDTKLLVSTDLTDPSTYMCNDDDRTCVTNTACSRLDVSFKVSNATVQAQQSKPDSCQWTFAAVTTASCLMARAYSQGQGDNGMSRSDRPNV